MKDEQKQEFTARIVNANRSDLVVIKYEMIFAYMEDARQNMQDNRWEEVKINLSRVERILDRLMEDLNFNYEISAQLYRLYRFCMEKTAMCRVKKQLTDMEDANMVLQNLYKAFIEVAKTDQSQPLMTGAQQLVTGVTYGKDSLNEIYRNDFNKGYII